MLKPIIDFFRRRTIKKHSGAIQTGLLPLSDISSVNVIIDVEEVGYDILKENILAWGRTSGLKVNIYFFDFRKLAKDELLLTSITNTITRRDLNWLGLPAYEKVSTLFEEQSDLLISLIDNGDSPIDYIAQCTRARFKIGRKAYRDHVYDMVISGRQTDGLRGGGIQVFAGITEFISKISK
jgi:hypothetical protein